VPPPPSQLPPPAVAASRRATALACRGLGWRTRLAPMPPPPLQLPVAAPSQHRSTSVLPKWMGAAVRRGPSIGLGVESFSLLSTATNATAAL
jgi:hypothetical protein